MHLSLVFAALVAAQLQTPTTQQAGSGSQEVDSILQASKQVLQKSQQAPRRQEQGLQRRQLMVSPLGVITAGCGNAPLSGCGAAASRMLQTSPFEVQGASLDQLPQSQFSRPFDRQQMSMAQMQDSQAQARLFSQQQGQQSQQPMQGFAAQDQTFGQQQQGQSQQPMQEFTAPGQFLGQQGTSQQEIQPTSQQQIRPQTQGSQAAMAGTSPELTRQGPTQGSSGATEVTSKDYVENLLNAAGLVTLPVKPAQADTPMTQPRKMLQRRDYQVSQPAKKYHKKNEELEKIIIALIIFLLKILGKL